MDVNGYMVVEFTDGLHVIPAIWFNDEKQSCIWPNHFKSQFRVNKALLSKEMPKEISDWEELPIKRIFSITSKYNFLNTKYITYMTSYIF